MADVSLPSLMIALLMQCSVVVYLLSDFLASSNVMVFAVYASATAMGQQSETIVLRRSGTVDRRPRRTPLYLTNIYQDERGVGMLSCLSRRSRRGAWGR